MAGYDKPTKKELEDADDLGYWTKSKEDKGFYGHMSVKKAHKGHEIEMCGRGDD